MDGLYLGVDVGTSATRVSLVRPGGDALVASAGYRTARGENGRVEQDGFTRNVAPGRTACLHDKSGDIHTA